MESGDDFSTRTQRPDAKCAGGVFCLVDGEEKGVVCTKPVDSSLMTERRAMGAESVDLELLNEQAAIGTRQKSRFSGYGADLDTVNAAGSAEERNVLVDPVELGRGEDGEGSVGVGNDDPFS